MGQSAKEQYMDLGDKLGKQLGARIKVQRHKAGLTLKEMSQKTGISVEKISELEMTGAIPIREFPKIWKVLSDEPFEVWFQRLME